MQDYQQMTKAAASKDRVKKKCSVELTDLFRSWKSFLADTYFFLSLYNLLFFNHCLLIQVIDLEFHKFQMNIAVAL